MRGAQSGGEFLVNRRGRTHFLSHAYDFHFEMTLKGLFLSQKSRDRLSGGSPEFLARARRRRESKMEARLRIKTGPYLVEYFVNLVSYIKSKTQHTIQRV